MLDEQWNDGTALTYRTFFRSWFRDHGREFPWREPSVSPFGVLLAEMLLRQTRAASVVPVWNELILRYPDPRALASADFELLSGWLQPLGLWRQRTSALSLVSEALVDRFDGNVPDNASHLASLPHVGVYTANAVLCFGFKHRRPIIDSNVLRVFSRLRGIEFGFDNRRSDEAEEMAWLILPKRGYIEHNYGLLDFSATICRPLGALHDECPLKDQCATGVSPLPYAFEVTPNPTRPVLLS
jgi:A/G-specific adenine glycosylase